MTKRQKWERSPEVKARQRAKQEAKWLPVAKEWAARYRAGETLDQIGQSDGVTREFVRQVMTKWLGIRARDGGGAVKATRNAQHRAQEKDKRYLNKYGCTFEQFKPLRGATLKAYTLQRRNAEHRGIEWRFTLWQWWTFWRESGHWHKRGRRRDNYVMCRYRDRGAYAIGNVFIATASENCSDIHINKIAKQSLREAA